MPRSSDSNWTVSGQSVPDASSPVMNTVPPWLSSTGELHVMSEIGRDGLAASQASPGQDQEFAPDRVITTSGRMAMATAFFPATAWVAEDHGLRNPRRPRRRKCADAATRFVP